MRYAELVEGNATEREIQEYLVGGDATTITLRIPGNLHESAKEAAALRGMSLSAFVRNCMIQELSKKKLAKGSRINKVFIGGKERPSRGYPIHLAI